MFIARSFLLLPALAVLAATLGGCESAIQVFPELFDQHELDYFRTHMIAVVQDDEDEIDPTSDTTYSIIKADPGFAERVHQATNTVGTSDAEINSRFLFSKVLRKSTDIHQDFSLVDKDTLKIKDSCDVHKDGPVEDKVGFVFMNDNPDATFVYGEEKVSVQAGKLVVFDGIVPHNTIVNRGTVQLAGPFQLRSFLTVGPELCDADELCCRGAGRRLEEGIPEAEPASSQTRGADHRRKRRALEEIRDLREAYTSCDTSGAGLCFGTCEPFCPVSSLPPCGTKAPKSSTKAPGSTKAPSTKAPDSSRSTKAPSCTTNPGCVCSELGGSCTHVLDCCSAACAIKFPTSGLSCTTGVCTCTEISG